jgi:hypothetical protein
MEQKNSLTSSQLGNRSNKDTGATTAIGIVATVNGATLSVNGSKKMSYR